MRNLSLLALFLLAAACATVPRGVHVEHNRLMNGRKALTPPFEAIDSFDVSGERGEVVFSAKRRGNFDVGLVALEGSAISWIPPDPADETAVQWAPRGNKISYVLHLPTGDVVRTVHIPTSTQLSVDFPNARVKALKWEASGDRYSVTLTSADASERIESLRYGGEERRVVAAPATQLDVAIEPLAGGLVMRPPSLKYGEKLPVVVWVVGDPLVWNDALGGLMKSARVAALVVAREPDAAAWSAVEKVPWIDAGRKWVVGAGVVQSDAAREIAGALTNGRR
jgi:hypothetical protein